MAETITRKNLAALDNKELLNELLMAADQASTARVSSRSSMFVSEDEEAARKWGEYVEEIFLFILEKMSK